MNNSPQNRSKRVLFVDDEPMVIEGLMRMLRAERDNFIASFASSGNEALTLLAKEHFDVVVTDINMPQMNGLELLSKIKKLYPDTVRIILSGEPDLDISIKAINVSHRFLNKPCDPELLKSTILKSCRLTDFLRNESLKKTLTKIDTLPSMPAIYFEITEELQSRNASIQKVGKIISQDMALTSKILQLVNSAYFSLPRHISSPEHAAALLGLDILKSLVLVVQVFKKFELQKMPKNFLELMFKHNLATGKIAKLIAIEESQDRKIIDNSFIAGLLHDCGKLILASSFSEEYRAIIKKSHEDKTSLWVSEEEVLGISHAEIGAYLMELWGLPSPIVEAIAYHHSPSMCGDASFSPLTAVYVANILEHESLNSEYDKSDTLLDSAYLADLNIDNRRPHWEAIRQNIANGA